MTLYVLTYQYQDKPHRVVGIYTNRSDASFARRQDMADYDSIYNYTITEFYLQLHNY